MRIVNVKGKCIECSKDTNIQLDRGVYACLDCLNRIGCETQNVREYLDMMSHYIQDMPLFMSRFLEVLSVMKENNITTVDNILKTLVAIQYYEEYKNGTLDDKTKHEIKKQLDIFEFL